MSVESLRSTIESHVNSNYTTYPIKYENLPFTTPVNSPWLSCSIKRNTLATPELSQDTPEIVGLLVFQVFVPKFSGLVESNKIVDTLASTYSDTIISRIWFKDAEITDVGTDKNWYQVNITFPFTYLGV